MPQKPELIEQRRWELEQWLWRLTEVRTHMA